MPRCRFARAGFPSLALITGHSVVAFSVACGGPPEAPQAPVVAATKPLASVATPAVDLTAVSAPATLVVSGHFAKPNASMATVRGWSKFPTPQSAQATEALLGDSVGALIDLEQPIDFAVAVGAFASDKGSGGGSFDDATPRFVVSAALSDPEAAKAALTDRYKLVPAGNGSLLLAGLGGGGKSGAGNDDKADESDDGDGASARRTCELSPAYGAAPTRVLCAWGDGRALAELGPWLTRTATRTASTADLHVDVSMQPLKVAFGDRLKMILSIAGGLVSGSVGSAGPRDLIMAVLSDLGDFFLDLNSASLDVDLSDPLARAVKTLKFSGTSSALTRLATANADRSAAPPALFWQMPADASFALFERGIDAQELARGRDLVLRAIAAELTEDGVKAADRDAIVAALGKLPFSAPAVYASGLDTSALRQALGSWGALGAGATQRERFDGARDAIQAAVGWHVVALDEPSSSIASAVTELVSGWSRPGVVAAYRAKWKDAEPPTLRMMPMPKRPGGDPWPTGALHVALELRPNAVPALRSKTQTAAKPITLHAFVVPDGPRTWVAAGGDDALVVAKLAAAMVGAGETLGGRAELAPLHDVVAGSGGFATVRGLAATVVPGIAAFGSSGDAAELFAAVTQLPHQGVTPMTFWTVAKTGATPSSVTATVQLPRGAIEDLIGVALQHGGI